MPQEGMPKSVREARKVLFAIGGLAALSAVILLMVGFGLSSDAPGALRAVLVISGLLVAAWSFLLLRAMGRLKSGDPTLAKKVAIIAIVFIPIGPIVTLIILWYVSRPKAKEWYAAVAAARPVDLPSA